MGMLVIVKDKKKKQNGAKHRQNPRGKPGLACFLHDNGRLIQLSAGQ